MQRTLKLITQYDRHRNEYAVLSHNLTPEAASSTLERLAAQLHALFLIDQHGVHAQDEPDGCPACRREVERTAHLQPKPTMKRRKS
jgi:hypothetical protein